MMYAYVKFHNNKSFHLWETELNAVGIHGWWQPQHQQDRRIPAMFHDFSVMLTNLKDSHDLTIVFWKKIVTHEFE